MFFTSFVKMVSHLPFSIIYFFSDILFFILYHIIRYRRRVVRTNLSNAFPIYTIEQICKIEKDYYHHMCDLFLESYKLLGMSESEIRERCKFINFDIINDQLRKGKNVVGVTGHYGNWEWFTSNKLWIDVAGADAAALYKPIRNQHVDELMKQIRSRFGATLIPKNDVLRYMVGKKKSNQNYFIAFVADQTPNYKNLNFWMDFLNQKTPIFLGTERLAAKFDEPVITVKIRKPKRGYYEIEMIMLTENPKSLPFGELTKLHTRFLEQQIIEAPHLWLWSHKRWKHTFNPEIHEFYGNE